MSKENEADDDSVSTGAFFTSDSVVDLLANNGCKVTDCYKPFGFDAKKHEHYPYISRVCACTVCKKCIDEQVVKACLGDLHKVKKGWAVECPLCGREKAFDNKHLLPNIAMANLCEELSRSIPHQTEEGEPKVEESKRASRKRKSK
jgi:hypothetical protein